MINKALLAAGVAGGLIVPVGTGLIIPPKPSIIKPENVEFSKHMLLGMPLTMGMVATSGNPIGGFVSSYEVASTSTYVYSFADCNIGKPAANRVIVVVSTAANPSGGTLLGSVTIAGVTATRAVTTSNSSRPLLIDYAVVPSGTTATISTRFGNNTDGIAIGVYAIYPSSSTPVDASENNTSGGQTSISISGLSKTAGGIAIFGAHSIDPPATSTITVTGETVTQDAYNSSLSSEITYNFSSIRKVSTTATVNPLCTWNKSVRERAFGGATWV